MRLETKPNQEGSLGSFPNSLPGGNGVLEPPESIPNSEVKRYIADDSVGSPHAKVGHCQALIQNPDSVSGRGFSFKKSGSDRRVSAEKGEANSFASSGANGPSSARPWLPGFNPKPRQRERSGFFFWPVSHESWSSSIPYFFNFLHNETRSMPRTLAAFVRLWPVRPSTNCM